MIFYSLLPDYTDTKPLGNGSAIFAIAAGSLTATYSGVSNYNANSGAAPVTVTTAVNPGITINGAAVAVAPGATTGNSSTITVTSSGGVTGSIGLTASVNSSPTGAQYPPTFSS